jgi:enolase
MVNKITKVRAREVLDSRGNPTVEVEVWAGAAMGCAIAPSGASTGVHEALELRDNDRSRYSGKGVLRAVDGVNTKIAKAITGLDCSKQEEADRAIIELDGTENKKNLGANAMVATSMAVAKCAAACMSVPLYRRFDPHASILPVPMLNVLNGGKHAGTRLSPQEFMIVPTGAPSFREALRMAAETYHTLAGILKASYGASAKNVGDEGGYAPNIKTTSEALGCLINAIEAVGYTKEISLAIDPAASSFYDSGRERYFLDGRSLTAPELVDYWTDIAGDYPIVSIEDPFNEEDFESFAALTERIGSRVQVIGDDIFVTNVRRIRKGIEKCAANSVLIKLNQVGTITETRDAIDLARRNGWTTVVSHRSGETEDTTIADFTVGFGTGQIKTGAPARGERTSKYNRLLRVEEELGTKAKYAGRNFPYAKNNIKTP